MKLYFIKSLLKRYTPLATILAEHLNLKVNILEEENILKLVNPNDIVYLTDNSLNNDRTICLSTKCYLLGPKKIVSNMWNNKSYQADNLKHITNIPHYKSYKTIIKIIYDLNYLKRKYKNFIIFENISDGGKRCHVCNEKTKPGEFFNKFKNTKTGFRVSKFIDNVHNISLHFIISDINKFWISPIIDQIIENKVTFKGGSYPSIISNNMKSKVIEETSKIAEFLSTQNYIGLCHIDFMIVDDIIYFTELNPRKAGTTMCMSYMMENCFNYSIPIIEYYAIKEKKIIDIKQIKKDIPWKLLFIPYTNNPSNNPGDERDLFKNNQPASITYNESYNTHSFKIDIHDLTK